MFDFKKQYSSNEPLAKTQRLFDLKGAKFQYEPYPIGLIRNIFEPDLYKRLVDSFPPAELFQFMQYHGDKWSLSELNNPDKYYQFLKSSPEWYSLYNEVKTEGFIDQVLDVLSRSKIELGLKSNHNVGIFQRLFKFLGSDSSHGLKARFEFSMMSAEGGHILPHTDSPKKVITLVVSMVQEGDWHHSWGGGTDLMRPLDPSDNYNFLNRYLSFDQVETIRTMEFAPNQCVIFIKTFNSLHAVKPMNGPKDVMRRTLTLNIETA